MEKSNGNCPYVNETECSVCATFVTDTTNDLLTQNAAMLKQNAIETATENERGIVDIETLKTTQSDIIETIEQTLQIQQNGRQNVKKRKELVGLEDELNNTYFR